MTDGLFNFLCIFAHRIESEVYRHTSDLNRLSAHDFRTMPEGDLAKASKQLRSAADFIDARLAEIEAERQRAA